MRPLLIAAITAVPLLAAPASRADTADPITKLFGPNAPECVPVAELRTYAKTTQLTPEQFQFARALFIAMPPISHQLPPGDHGLLATAEDGVTFIALVNGDKSCARFIAPDFVQEMLMKVGEGETVPAGQAM